MKLLVVLPCCFKSAGQMCATSYARAKVAVQLWEHDPSQWAMATATVPYRKNGSAVERQTLTDLMVRHLYVAGISRERFLPAPGGVDTHSEATAMAHYLSQMPAEQVTIVGSSWYFWGGRLMWRHVLRDFRRRHGRVVCVSAPGGLGPRTLVFYGGQAVLFHAVWPIGQLDRLGLYLSARHAKRRAGFTKRGCG